MTETLDYYNKNAEKFSSSTQDLEFSEVQDRFLSYLNKGALILDFGCGAGRDSKYFLEKGYKVKSIDGSEELAKIATETAGIPVEVKLFTDLNDIDMYDGIWACSSILHCPKDELKIVFRKIHAALKSEGIFYTSFKNSEFEGMRNGRYFTDMTPEKFRSFLEEVSGFEITEQWISSDVRPGRANEKWLNLILKAV